MCLQYSFWTSLPWHRSGLCTSFLITMTHLDSLPIICLPTYTVLIIIPRPFLSETLTFPTSSKKKKTHALGHFEQCGKNYVFWKSLVMVTITSYSALFCISSEWERILMQALTRIWMPFCDLPQLISLWLDLLKGSYLCGSSVISWISGCWLYLKNQSSMWLAETEWCNKSPLIGWLGALGVIWVSVNEAISIV